MPSAPLSTLSLQSTTTTASLSSQVIPRRSNKASPRYLSQDENASDTDPLEFDPDDKDSLDMDALQSLAMFETRCGRYQRAQEAWQQMMKLEPTNVSNLLRFAKWAEKDYNNVPMARSLYDRLLDFPNARDVRQPWVLRQWATFEQRHGQFERAQMINNIINEVVPANKAPRASEQQQIKEKTLNGDKKLTSDVSASAGKGPNYSPGFMNNNAGGGAAGGNFYMPPVVDGMTAMSPEAAARQQFAPPPPPPQMQPNPYQQQAMMMYPPPMNYGGYPPQPGMMMPTGGPPPNTIRPLPQGQWQAQPPQQQQMPNPNRGPYSPGFMQPQPQSVMMEPEQEEGFPRRVGRSGFTPMTPPQNMEEEQEQQRQAQQSKRRYSPGFMQPSPEEEEERWLEENQYEEKPLFQIPQGPRQTIRSTADLDEDGNPTFDTVHSPFRQKAGMSKKGEWQVPVRDDLPLTATRQPQMFNNGYGVPPYGQQPFAGQFAPPPPQPFMQGFTQQPYGAQFGQPPPMYGQQPMYGQGPPLPPQQQPLQQGYPGQPQFNNNQGAGPKPSFYGSAPRSKEDDYVGGRPPPKGWVGGNFRIVEQSDGTYQIEQQSANPRRPGPPAPAPQPPAPPPGLTPQQQQQFQQVQQWREQGWDENTINSWQQQMGMVPMPPPANNVVDPYTPGAELPFEAERRRLAEMRLMQQQQNNTKVDIPSFPVPSWVKQGQASTMPMTNPDGSPSIYAKAEAAERAELGLDSSMPELNKDVDQVEAKWSPAGGSAGWEPPLKAESLPGEKSEPIRSPVPEWVDKPIPEWNDITSSESPASLDAIKSGLSTSAGGSKTSEVELGSTKSENELGSKGVIANRNEPPRADQEPIEMDESSFAPYFSDLDQMSDDQLKSELKALNLPIPSRKTEGVDRLKRYFIELELAAVAELQKDFKMLGGEIQKDFAWLGAALNRDLKSLDDLVHNGKQTKIFQHLQSLGWNFQKAKGPSDSTVEAKASAPVIEEKASIATTDQTSKQNPTTSTAASKAEPIKVTAEVSAPISQGKGKTKKKKKSTRSTETNGFAKPTEKPASSKVDTKATVAQETKINGSKEKVPSSSPVQKAQSGPPGNFEPAGKSKKGKVGIRGPSSPSSSNEALNRMNNRVSKVNEQASNSSQSRLKTRLSKLNGEADSIGSKIMSDKDSVSDSIPQRQVPKITGPRPWPRTKANQSQQNEAETIVNNHQEEQKGGPIAQSSSRRPWPLTKDNEEEYKKAAREHNARRQEADIAMGRDHSGAGKSIFQSSLHEEASLAERLGNHMLDQ